MTEEFDVGAYIYSEKYIPALLEPKFGRVLGKYILKHGSDGNNCLAAFAKQLILSCETATAGQRRCRNTKIAKRLRKNGLTFSEIGTRLGISTATASKYCRT